MQRRISTLFASTAVALLSALPIPVDSAPEREKIDLKSIRTASSQIDSILASAYREHGIKANPEASDDTFVRRIYLDIAGRIPTRDETERFLADQNPDKRSLLIDSLLDSEGYVNNFFNFWADILRINSQVNGGSQATPAYINFVKDSLRQNKPYDQFVRDLITADGDVDENGAAAYYVRDRGMALDNMANTVRIFLGTRLECAQCHDHPFDKWTQMDFYKMAAYTYGVSGNRRYGGGVMEEAQKLMSSSVSRDERRTIQRSLQEIARPLRNTSGAQRTNNLPKLPHDYQYSDAKPNQKIMPQPMFDAPPSSEDVANDPDRRVLEYADWITAPENPRFAKVIANRLWREAFGIALIEPVDEIMDNTEASVPELMAFLENKIVEFDFDMKAYLRMVYNTAAYQRAATADLPGPGVAYHFPGPVLRRMSAEQIWDSVVTLVSLDPDTPDWKSEEQYQERVRANALLLEALEKRGAATLLEDAKRISQIQKKHQKHLEDLQEQIADARKNKDEDLARTLGRQVNQLRNELYEEIKKRVYDPATKHMPEAAEYMDSPMISMTGSATPKFTEALNSKEQERIGDEMDALGISDPKDRKNFARFRAESSRNFLRAANLRSPAPPGHFLREFGQSDRETIENSLGEASIPQALMLMNGNSFSALTNPLSRLSLSFKNEGSPEAKIDAIFTAALSRPATPEEREAILSTQASRGDSIYADTIFAILNAPEFLFIQ